MKLIRAILVASLVLNVLLLARAVHQPPAHQSSQFTRPLRIQVNNPARVSRRRPSRPAPPATPWQAVESGDLVQFAANLRDIGCPEQTIRDILVMRVSRQFQSRLQSATDAAAREQPWWRGWDYSLQSQELSLLRPALRRERDDLVEQLFGEPANRLTWQILGRPGGVASGREFLSEEKRAPLREIEARYAQLMASVTFPAGQPLDEDDSRALADLRRRQRAEIDSLLTPQELEELDLRESSAARYVLRALPQALAEFDFRIMVRAAQDVGINTDAESAATSMSRRYGLGSRNMDDQQQQSEEAQREAVQTRAKQLLGEKRFSQLEQAEAAHEEFNRRSQR